MGVNTGALYIIFIMLILFGLAYVMSGPTPSQTPILTGPEAVITQPQSKKAQAMLQLYNFAGATITPPISGLCKKGGANTHPEALVAYTPPQATAISNQDQITLWVSDTLPPHIAPNEQVLGGSGAIKVPGDRAALAPDGYRWEPQLYIFPATLENGGQPYFPNFIRGGYNNGAAMDSHNNDVIPPDHLPTSNTTVEFLWNVKDIGLTDNEYQIEFVAHDGNNGMGVKCITIRVYTPPETQNRDNKLPL